ncbi:MAG: sigma-54-dependent transcriptional regulator [Leptospirales bacterium]
MPPFEKNSPPVFIVDDDPLIVKQLVWLLKEEFPVLTAGTFAEGVEVFFKEHPPVAILDLFLGDPDLENDGLALLRLFSESDPDFHGIILSGSADRPKALEAVRLGAYDLLDKSIEPADLKQIISRAYKRALLGRDSRKPAIAEVGALPGNPAQLVITESPRLVEMLRTLAKVSKTNISILITGESGTGKEVFAKACHDLSSHRDGPFVAVNCGAIPDNLLESELFGHEKGAFTGATESRPGKFEVADKGTLFLDEVAELPLELQVKLLRVLQDKVVERVGARVGKKLDLRIVAATNRDIGERMSRGLFREDLYYRLGVMSFHLPPLREREGDILVLSRHFLDKFKVIHMKPQLMDFSQSSYAILKKYSWPGNIRELENRIQRAVIIANGKWIRPEDLDIVMSDDSGTVAGLPVSTLHDVRADAEKKMLSHALDNARGNISQVARVIGTSRPTVHALIKKYGLNPRTFRAQ